MTTSSADPAAAPPKPHSSRRSNPSNFLIDPTPPQINKEYPNVGWPQSPDTEINDLLDAELERQQRGLQLIASENFASPAVMASRPACS